MLSNINTHERDAHITFDEEPHIYTIDGNSDNTSVTTFVHSHFSKFDSDKIITKMMSSSKWKKNKYYGKTRQQIKDEWKQNGQEAARAGTKLHHDIECFYNNIPHENTSIEYNHFIEFTKTYPKLIPYRTEWMIWHEDLQLAGSIDMVFVNSDRNTYEIYDWKRSKEIKKTTPWITFSKTSCIEHIPDTNYWHYCLQLNVYKAILEAKYGLTIAGMYLVRLYPTENSFQRLKVVDLQEEVQELFNLREQQLRYG